MRPLKILIFGATSTIAHECARRFNEKNNCFFTLIGRNISELNKNELDLKARNNKSSVEIINLDFSKPNFIKYLNKDLIRVDIIILAHGVMFNNMVTEKNIIKMNQININSYSIILNYIRQNADLRKIKIVIFGSVAGDRGKQSNLWYGSTKSYLFTLYQGLQHDAAINKKNIQYIFVKPGPTLTKMTMNINDSFNFATAKNVSKIIVDGIQKNKKVIYAPAKWMLIMFIIKILPNFIFNKLRI